MSTEAVEKNSKNYPILRNLQYSPLKQGEEQYIVLWDPTGLSAEKLVLPLNYFYLFQFFMAALHYRIQIFLLVYCFFAHLFFLFKF